MLPFFAALLLSAQALAMPIDDAKTRSWNGHFPKGAFHEATDDFVSAWYSKGLEALDEPVLKDRIGRRHTTWRFLWLRTWGAPVAVRVEQDAKGWSVTWKQSDGQGGYEPGKLTSAGTRRLTPKEIETMRARFAAARLTELPTQDPAMGLDGAQWVMEGIVDGNYHLVDRWSPEEGDAYRAACWTLLGFTPLGTTPTY